MKFLNSLKLLCAAALFFAVAPSTAKAFGACTFGGCTSACCVTDINKAIGCNTDGKSNPNCATAALVKFCHSSSKCKNDDDTHQGCVELGNVAEEMDEKAVKAALALAKKKAPACFQDDEDGDGDDDNGDDDN